MKCKEGDRVKILKTGKYGNIDFINPVPGGNYVYHIVLNNGDMEYGVDGEFEVVETTIKCGEQRSMDFGSSFNICSDDSDVSKCVHKNKYKNVISKTLQFWVCSDCKADLGDVE